MVTRADLTALEQGISALAKYAEHRGQVMFADYWPDLKYPIRDLERLADRLTGAEQREARGIAAELRSIMSRMGYSEAGVTLVYTRWPEILTVPGLAIELGKVAGVGLDVLATVVRESARGVIDLARRGAISAGEAARQIWDDYQRQRAAERLRRETVIDNHMAGLAEWTEPTALFAEVERFIDEAHYGMGADALAWVRSFVAARVEDVSDLAFRTVLPLALAGAPAAALATAAVSADPSLDPVAATAFASAVTLALGALPHTSASWSEAQYASPQGQAQVALMEAVAGMLPGQGAMLTDLARRLRGVHFSRIESAAAALAAKGLIEFDGVTVRKLAASDRALVEADRLMDGGAARDDALRSASNQYSERDTLAALLGQLGHTALAQALNRGDIAGAQQLAASSRLAPDLEARIMALKPGLLSRALSAISLGRGDDRADLALADPSAMLRYGIVPLSAIERRVLEAIQAGATSTAAIAVRAGISAGDAEEILSQLWQDKIVADAGGRWSIGPGRASVGFAGIERAVGQLAAYAEAL